MKLGIVYMHGTRQMQVKPIMYRDAAYVLALKATQTTKDMDWAAALAGPDANKAVEALQLEMKSLQETILTRISEDHPDYPTA
jgi:predicted component of type VI protein secretion system